MAIIKSVLKFQGKLEGMNAFLPKNRDESDGYILRKNGGPTSKQIQKLPSCEKVRKINHEFGTCSAASKAIRMAISPVTHLTDMNLASQFTALCRHLLILDTGNPLGERIVSFLTHGHLMSGFNLNKKYLFDSVVRHPLFATLDHHTATAVIRFPALQPGVNLVIPWQQPLYRFIISLGAAGYYKHQQPPASFVTPWYTSQQTVEAQEISLQLLHQLGIHECMVVAVGIEMGTMVSDAIITQVPHIGSGKILIAG